MSPPESTGDAGWQITGEIEPHDVELYSDLKRFVDAHGIRLDVDALMADLDDQRRQSAEPPSSSPLKT